jgi:hypothetical protein
MSEETVQTQAGPKKRLTKTQAVVVMVAGGLLILIPWFFFPTEQGSSLQIVKTIVGTVGFVVLCAGAFLRP